MTQKVGAGDDGDVGGERVYGMAGLLGSGKTFVASILAEQFGCIHLRSRHTVEAMVRALGLPVSETTMQDVGARIVSAIGGDGLTKLVLLMYDPGKSYAYDSLRNVRDVEYLRERFGDSFKLIYIDTDEELRAERFRSRAHRANSPADFAARSAHPVEQEVTRLRELADYVIANHSRSALVERLSRITSGRR